MTIPRFLWYIVFVMKKIIHIIIKIVFSLLLVSPILGTFGVFPAPTAEMYSNPQAFQFIQVLMSSHYIMILMAIVHILALIALWTRREALAAALELPIVLNIVGFHAFLDGGLLTTGAIMGNVLLIIVLYVMWKNRGQYNQLLGKN